MEGVARAERRDGSGEACRSAEADLRIEIGGRDADPRGRGGQRALGAADVGAAADQRAAVADRERAGERGRLGAGRDVLRIIGGRAAHQRGEPVERSSARRDLGGDQGLALVDRGPGARHVERGPAAAALQALRDVERLALQREDPGVGGEHHVGGARGGIAARGFCGDGDADIVARGGDGLRVALGRLDPTADAARQVERVGERDAEIVVERAGQIATGRIGAVERGAAAEHGRQRAAGGDFGDHRIGAAEVGVGGAQVGVGGERFGDEPVEAGVAVELPPMVGKRGVDERLFVAAVELASRGRHVDGGAVGEGVVRAGGGAGGEGERGDDRCDTAATDVSSAHSSVILTNVRTQSHAGRRL